MSELKTNLEQILQEKETKIIPENIKKDIQIFDVIGTLESSVDTSGVKLFETVEEMQADTTAQEGDLALIYGKQSTNLNKYSKASSISFKDTITLSEPITENITGKILRHTGGVSVIVSRTYNMTISSTGCYIRDAIIAGLPDTPPIVEYASTNGLTYTLVTEITNPVFTGDDTEYYTIQDDTGICFDFITGETNVFDGVYEKYQKGITVPAVYDWRLVNTQFTLDNTNQLLKGASAYGQNGVIEGTLETLDTSDATATSSDILYPKTAYVNGEKITGSLPLFPNTRTFIVDNAGVTNNTEDSQLTFSTINTLKQTLDNNLNMEFSANYTDIAAAIGLTADKIKEGETILGITGTYSGDELQAPSEDTKSDEEVPVKPGEEILPDSE